VSCHTGESASGSTSPTWPSGGTWACPSRAPSVPPLRHLRGVSRARGRYQVERTVTRDRRPPRHRAQRLPASLASDPVHCHRADGMSPACPRGVACKVKGQASGDEKVAPTQHVRCGDAGHDQKSGLRPRKYQLATDPAFWDHYLAGYEAGYAVGLDVGRAAAEAEMAARWAAVRQRRVECPACAQRAYRATIGTPEDRTCDRCRILIPAGIIEVATWAVGPLLVSVGHCRGCRDAVRGPGVAA
jgi:hypothetical protein